MFSKYLIGLVGLGTVARGAVATTIALTNKSDDQVKKSKTPKENKESGQPKEINGPTGSTEVQPTKDQETDDAKPDTSLPNSSAQIKPR